jgi:molecular chaperone DnaK
MSQVIGIDLGTSNSAVAAILDGKHQILPDENGRRLTPSIVSFGKDKQILIGEDAKAQLFSNPFRTIHSIKRLMGRKIYSPEAEKAKALLPYRIVAGPEDNCAIQIDDQLYLPQEISALILKRMKDIAQLHLGPGIEKAVVTVPAYFNDNQRQATADACRLAGLDAIRMINEPTAAALAYGFGKKLEETVAIYDLGGGTFDISILRLRNQVFEVLATAGDTFLGGDDFDDRIIDLCAEFFLKKTKIDLRTIPQALPLLRVHAEKAKRKLSYAEKTDVYIPSIIKKDEAGIDLLMPLSREMLGSACEDLVQRTFSVCDEALRAAGMKSGQLNAIILVGGPTKMNVVSDAVAGYFGKPPLKDLNPDEVVALGASIQAVALSSADPKVKSRSLLLDVTPLDLGIATVGGFTENIIEANSPIPIEACRTFTTTSNDQTSVSIRIFQGRNRREEESVKLGEFEFSGFHAKKAGDVSIDVVFGINTDGIVEVSAKDPETGASHSMKVKMSSTIPSDRIKNSTSQIQSHKLVALKSPVKNHHKLVVCTTGSQGYAFEEGYAEWISPEEEVLILKSETGKISKEIPRSSIVWILNLEDFSNTPRYLQAISAKPALAEAQPRMPLYEFRLKNGSSIFGQSNSPSLKELGIWIQPFFPSDELNGKLFIFSSRVDAATPIGIQD